MKNFHETINEIPELKQDLDKTINDSLMLELRNMEDRRPERNDVKFRVLKQFISDLANSSFEDVYDKLSESHKHSIITRMENQAEHMGGKIPYNHIETLRNKLYGDADGQDTTNQRQFMLEEQLQSEDKNFYSKTR